MPILDREIDLFPAPGELQPWRRLRSATATRLGEERRTLIKADQTQIQTYALPLPHLSH